MKTVEAYDNFINSRRLKDLSEKTITDYQQFLFPFIKALGEDRDFHTLEQEDINNYIRRLLKKPLSKATKATYIRHIKVFLQWCENEYGSRYRAKQIKIPKSPKKSVKIYSESDIREIFSVIHAETPWLTYRNKCIIALMYDSGLRQSEVCTLLRSRISFTDNRITVHGKGDKERIVPIGQLTQRYMKLYMEACPYTSDTLFVSRRGEKMTCNAVKLFVTKLADKLPFELSSHKLRHNFATNYCIDQYDRNGHIDIYSLMYLMGHEELATTQRYLHFAMEIISARGAISHLDYIITGEI